MKLPLLFQNISYIFTPWNIIAPTISNSFVLFGFCFVIFDSVSLFLALKTVNEYKIPKILFQSNEIMNKKLFKIVFVCFRVIYLFRYFVFVPISYPSSRHSKEFEREKESNLNENKKKQFRSTDSKNSGQTIIYVFSTEPIPDNSHDGNQTKSAIIFKIDNSSVDIFYA